jgi:CubicO group peptidase (beta-lactamase class C family)
MTRPRYRRAGPLRWQDRRRDPYSAAMGTMGKLDTSKVDALVTRARREVDDGFLPSAQVALARDGELVAFETFGDATADTRYPVFSATKAFVAGAMWALIGDGLVDVSKPVVDYVPEFGTNGKDVVTVEQVMLHTSGFPHAPLGPPQWSTPQGRREAFAKWRLNWEPGTSYEYHATSAHWVLSAIIENVTGADFRDVVEDRVTTPAGLPRVLGIDRSQQDDIADIVTVGEPASAEEIKQAFGVDELPVTEVTPEVILAFNRPESREVGVPGGGAVMRACDLAMYYQAVLHDQGDIWKPDVLADVTTVVRNRIPERWSGVPANRSLGLILAGDDGYSHIRGLGRTVSAGAFGHNGAGGQLAWADPATGLSLGYTTNGYDLHVVREPKRGTAISSLAGVCVE